MDWQRRPRESNLGRVDGLRSVTFSKAPGGESVTHPPLLRKGVGCNVFPTAGPLQCHGLFRYMCNGFWNGEGPGSARSRAGAFACASLAQAPQVVSSSILEEHLGLLGDSLQRLADGLKDIGDQQNGLAIS